MEEPTTVTVNRTKETIWTNELIWDKITSYLRISDLKALHLVNKQFLDNIRRNPRLVFKQTLKTNLEVHVPVLNRAIVEVNKINEYYLDHFGSEVLENVTHLELQRLWGKSKQIRNGLLKRIICHCKMLKSLAFGDRNFFKKDYQDLFRDEEVKQILSQLDELHIAKENKNYNPYAYDSDSDEEDFEDSESSEDESSPWYSNSDSETHPLENKLFPGLNLQLKKLTFREPYYGETPRHFYPELILGCNLNFLVDIDLELDISGIERLNSINIPKLTSLKLQFFGRKFRGVKVPDYEQVFIDYLLPFIKTHVENLQTFALRGRMEYCLEPICEILKTAKKVESLSLKSGCHFQHSIQFVDWDFLQTLSTLQFFELKMYECEDFDENEIFGVIQLMNRVPVISDLWLRSLIALPLTVTSIQMFAFWKEDEIPQRLQVTETLAKFQNLTELSMLFCYEFLLDDTLQFICSHLTKLKILKADFSKITDYGISGCRTDGSDSGISLKSLKRLNELKMSFCYHNCPRSITWKGLLKSVRLLDLIRLSIGGSLKDLHGDSDRSDKRDTDNYLRLIQQNPSLESCCLKFYRPENWFVEEASKLNPRLKLK